MSIPKPRLVPGPLTREAVDRTTIDLCNAVDAEFAKLLVGLAAVLVEVPAAQAAASFTFPTTRRRYDVPAPGAGTTDVRVFNAGETIVQHPLGRRPRGRIVCGQAAASALFDLDVAALSPALDPAQFVAFRSSATTTFKILLF